MIIFRWSVWNCSSEILLLLNHSIGTFQHFFQQEARYVVFTDKRAIVQAALRVPAEVFEYTEWPAFTYLDLEATWRKWAPVCRMDVNAVEFRIDADMFLLQDPVELRWFYSARNTEKEFLVTWEGLKENWPTGNLVF